MQPIAAESETLERFRHLLFMLPPLLLYASAVVLFEASADPDKPFSPLLLAAVQGSSVPGVEQALAELKARLVWLAAALLNIVVPLAAMLYCIVPCAARWDEGSSLSPPQSVPCSVLRF